MKLQEIVGRLSETPIEAFNTVGDFSRSSSFRKEADRRLLTNPKTVERAKNMFANTQFDFRFWFVNNAEANRYTNVGIIDLNWLQQNMPTTLAEIQQQGGFGPQSINMIYANNKGGNWRPMTGWMMAHRMAHAVLDGLSTDYKSRPIEYIARELLQNLESLLNAYEIQLPKGRPGELLRHPMIRNILMQMGTMKSSRTRNVDTGYEFIFECFAQYLLTGQLQFNPLPQNLITGYSGGRPMTRRVYGQVDLEQANDYASYIADILGQEFDRALNGVIGKVVLM